MHVPVMVREVVEWMRPQQCRWLVDGTVGAGGHAEALLEGLPPEGRLLGIDVDPTALRTASDRLARFGDRCILRRARYSALPSVIAELGWPAVDGVLLDLGVSSLQLDDPARGFSFQRDGPLDMRMDPSLTTTAAELVNRLSESELADLLWRLGEEPRARRIARAIVRRRAQRPFARTVELADCVCAAVGSGRVGGRHPATRTFLALRLAVNRELDEVEQGLSAAWRVLRPGGRLVVIAFHSLEDRRVKQFMRERARASPADGVVLTPHVVRPTGEECAHNPRARSARLRVLGKRGVEGCSGIV